MTTVLDQPVTRSQASTGDKRNCPGCPRCQDPEASWCSVKHQEFNNWHPLCKWCRHCVLNGKHIDDCQDLEDPSKLRNLSSTSPVRQFGNN